MWSLNRLSSVRPRRLMGGLDFNRAQHLQLWLHRYNWHRPHSSRRHP